MRIVEIGCSKDAVLMRNLREPERELVCYEPSRNGSLVEVLTSMLKKNSSNESTAIGTLFDATEHVARFGQIDLFISSHVLEHHANLCDFATELFAAMSPGGAVFTETPNHDRNGILRAHGHTGGVFHITFPSPRAMVLIMESAGFRLGVLQTVSCASAARCGLAAAMDGAAVRSIFFKPSVALA